MKTMKMKTILLLALVAALLLGTVGGTVAYLVTSTGPVTNTFTPGNVDGTIDETFDNGVKRSVTIRNTGSVASYIRVAIVGNWVVTEEDGSDTIVDSWTWSHNNLATGWLKIGNYYYYTSPVAVGGSTSNLLADNIISSSTREDGAHLEVTVIQQSIQAEPTTAVTSTWGVALDNDGNITGAASSGN